MLSIGRVAPDRAHYYLDSVAVSPEAYYLGDGEAPGEWTGRAAADLGLAGEVAPKEFRRLLHGRHPTVPGALVANPEGRVGAFDLTFSAPKSVSLLWALHPDAEVRQAVAEAHRTAIEDALAYLEDHALWARRGHAGARREEVTGLVAAGFTHRTSREDDPHLHTHMVVPNLVCDHGGRWSAPDSRAIFRHARAAGHVYQAALRYELTADLGVQWGPVTNGQADLAGIPRTVIESFSARRAQVVDRLEELGLSSSSAARVATLDTRQPKHPAGENEPLGLLGQWQSVAAEVGLDVEDLPGPARTPVVPDPDRLEDRLVGPAGLTAGTASFDRRALVCELAAAHPEGVTGFGLEELCDRVTAAERVINLTPDQPIGSGSEGRWTTVDHLALETDLQHLAARPWPAGTPPVGVARAAAVAQALGDRDQLSAEQAAVVSGICSSGNRVVTVIGKAGTGKTFALDAARAAWQNDGTPVIGAALAARAAAELQAGSAIPSTTLARLTADISRPEGRLLPGTVIVVDEAGMVGTRQLHHLLSLADAQHAKVVLVGDSAQLPEIAAGGSFARLAQRQPTFELTTNRRQTQGWERAALDQLRERQAAPALARYGTEGRITLADTAPDLRAQMAADWHAARSAGAEVVMLAVRRTDVADLNSRAQAELVAGGRLDPNGPAVAVGGGARALVGDEVVCGRNDRRAGLLNGTRLTVTDIDAATRSISGIDADGFAVTVPGSYIDDGHVALGYASTIHKAQGRTVDHALLLGDDWLFAEAGYVGMSRGRDRNQLYLVAPNDPPTMGAPGGLMADHVCKALGTSKAQALSTAGVEDRLPDGHLGVLVGERDRLTSDLLSAMPPPLSPDVDGHFDADAIRERDAWTTGYRRDGERLARLSAGIDQRHGRLGLAALTDPPEHLVALIGPPPDNPREQRQWSRAAADIEAWREVSGRRADRGAPDLFAEPAWTDPGRDWWSQATRSLTNHQHLIRTNHPEQVQELDRSWARSNERGLSL